MKMDKAAFLILKVFSGSLVKCGQRTKVKNSNQSNAFLPQADELRTFCGLCYNQRRTRMRRMIWICTDFA